jgi:hypothetical protein
LIAEEKPHISANDAFTPEERRDLAEAMSKALDVQFEQYERFEAAVEVPPYLYVALGYLTGKIIDKIIDKIASALWEQAKKKYVKTIAQHKSTTNRPSRIGFEFEYEGAKTTMSVQSEDPLVIGQAFDKIGEVLKDVRQLAAEGNLPGTKSEIYYVFQGEAWAIDGAVIMKPSFDKVKFDPKSRKWISQDPRAAEALRRFRTK